MSKVAVDVAAVPVVAGELTTTEGPDPHDSHTPGAVGLGMPTILVATGASVIWLCLLVAYVLSFTPFAALAALPPETVPVYLVAAVVPVLTIWLLALYIEQQNTLRRTTGAWQNSFLALARPDETTRRHMDEIIETLAIHADALNRSTHDAAAQTEAMSSMILRQTELLRTASENAEDRARRIRSMLQDQEQELVSAASALEQRTDSIRGLIDDGARTLSSVSADAAERTRIAHNILNNRAEDLAAAADKAATTTENMAESYARLVREFNEATESARRQAEGLTEHFTSQSEGMTAAGENLAARTHAITEAMRREVEALDDAGDRALGRIGEIEKATSVHAEKMNLVVEDTHKWVSQTADYFAAQAYFMRDTAEEAVNAIDAGTRAAVQSVDEAGADLTKTVENLNVTAQSTAARVLDKATQLQDNMATLEYKTVEATDNLANAASRGGAAMREEKAALESAIVSLSAMTEGLQSTLASAFERLDTAGSTLMTSHRVIDEAGTLALQRAQEITALYGAESDRLSRSTDATAKDVAQLKATIDATVETLRGLAQEVSAQSSAVELNMENQARLVRAATESAIGGVQHIEHTLSVSAEGLLQATNTACAEVDETAEGMIVQLEQIRDLSRGSADYMEATIANLGESAGAVAHESGQAGQHLKQVSDLLLHHEKNAKAATERATERILTVSEILEHASQNLTAMAATTANDIAGSVETLAEQSAHIETKARNSAAIIDESGSALVERAAEMSDKAQTITAGLTAASEALKTATELAGNDAREFQTQAQNITDSAREIVVAAQSVSTHAEKADHIFRARTDNLAETATRLVNHTNELQQLENRVGDKAFMQLADNVTRHLTTLSIDIDKIIEDDIPAKVWRQYQKGDTTVFARRLLNISDRKARAKIMKLYGDDERFRTSINSYIQQFETLIDQATNAERGELLAGTFLTSNVGKVYVLLARSIGRLS